ncbi:MAG TPA: hypothetical protein VL501_04840 [Pyrinomonadaceae bacterium]|jgi:hypothetical protein|nr:hypothetical protein [Pyrinomonadaceae bacterium]
MATKTESADLILKLYDLRREKKMRKAREWFFGFNPTSVDEYWQTMMDPKVGAYARMVISYWDMAATMVVQGAIDAELFNQTAGEHIMVFAKVEPILAGLRERFQNPEALKNLEKVIMDMPDGAERVKKAQEFMAMIRDQMAAAAGKDGKEKSEEAAA